MTIRWHEVTDVDVLEGFDALADIYSHVPPLIMWRAWEHAVYRRYRLPGPVLISGAATAASSIASFLICVTSPAWISAPPWSSMLATRAATSPSTKRPQMRCRCRMSAFNAAFANCSLEHMDNIDGVLAEVHRVLRPGGTFLFSVVTDRFITRAPLQWVLEASGGGDLGSRAQRNHESTTISSTRSRSTSGSAVSSTPAWRSGRRRRSSTVRLGGSFSCSISCGMSSAPAVKWVTR